jgi:hypothetical protein
MLKLHDENLVLISEFLKDKQKIYLTMTSKRMDVTKHKFIYYKKIRIDTISRLSYFDNFASVKICSLEDKLPKYVKWVYYLSCRSEKIPTYITHLTLGRSFNKKITVPPSLIYTKFGRNFNQSINDCIPSSVTHLTFGDDFNQPINNCIPSSVTHLKFGSCFNQSINGCIPQSVKRLEFGYFFNQPIKDCIPPLVTDLILSYHFNQSIEGCIPSSVTYIAFGYFFRQSINNLPMSVKRIVLEEGYDLPIDKTIFERIDIRRF